MIKKVKGLYFVYNKAGKKRLSKGYRSYDDALHRLRQIEFFKHLGG